MTVSPNPLRQLTRNEARVFREAVDLLRRTEPRPEDAAIIDRLSRWLDQACR